MALLCPFRIYLSYLGALIEKELESGPGNPYIVGMKSKLRIQLEARDRTLREQLEEDFGHKMARHLRQYDKKRQKLERYDPYEISRTLQNGMECWDYLLNHPDADTRQVIEDNFAGDLLIFLLKKFCFIR